MKTFLVTLIGTVMAGILVWFLTASPWSPVNSYQKSPLKPSTATKSGQISGKTAKPKREEAVCKSWVAIENQPFELCVVGNRYSWTKAEEYSRDRDYNHLTDWRLPSMDEAKRLTEIFGYTREETYHLFGGVFYWTSSPGDSKNRYAFNFYDNRPRQESEDSLNP